MDKKPTTIAPTIGRKVWFWNASEVGVRDAHQPWDATIHFVHEDVAGAHVVDLTVTDHYGVTACERGITLRDPADGDGHSTGRRYATWMPYQIGQAKKA